MKMCFYKQNCCDVVLLSWFKKIAQMMGIIFNGTMNIKYKLKYNCK